MLDEKKTVEQLGREATNYAIDRGVVAYSTIRKANESGSSSILEVIERELRRAYLAGADAAKDGVR